MSSRSALVFPGGMPSALTWARRAAAAGMRVVGASSLSPDPAQRHYQEWEFLPWIADAAFAPSLSQSLAARRIDLVYSSHAVIWTALKELLPQVAPTVGLEPAHPWDADLADYRAYRARAARLTPLELAGIDPRRPPLRPLELAALVRQFEQTPGQCDYQKVEGFLAVFPRLPEGDIVEIGSLLGRSALVLAFLARHYAIGKLLCVDPWGGEELLQGIPQVDEASREVPIAEIFDAFRINLAPYAGMANYARARSTDAARRFRERPVVATEDFGETAYTGGIALLHIDGNHAEDAVRDDIALWQPLLRPGGWIVFDDYYWPFGDGPRRAADDFCRRHSQRITTAFAAGGALFLALA
jgi:SAM-dependent methyltransferase